MAITDSYTTYYFEDDQWDAPTLAATFKKMLLKWADALQKISRENNPLFLPFAPDDQEIECLRVTYWSRNKITFSWVELGEDGWAVDLTDIERFSTEPHEVRKESPEFGECDKDEFVAALINAEVLDGP